MEKLSGMKHIVLWGASYLGRAIGKYLDDNGFSYDFFWDARFEELKTVKEKAVVEPFTGIDNPDDTLVILCIGNTAIRGSLLKQLNEHGFRNVKLGPELYEEEVCPFNEQTGIDGTVCNGSMICRSMFCERLHRIVKAQNDRGGLFLPNITFMITSYCSLGCKYCVSYMNSYSQERRFHFSVEQIEKDIDAIFSAVDSIGSITIQGGEPFLHPDLDCIVQKMLSKKNFGIVSVATNGIFKIDEAKLECFKDKRLNVAFSGYYDALPKEKLDIYYANVDMMEKNGVPHTVGVKMPEWVIPSTLYDRHQTKAAKAEKKRNCLIPMRCMQVMNGRLYPCLFSVSLHGAGVADYPDDYIDLHGGNLSLKIKAFMEREYYDSCGHCFGKNKKTGLAGEQGFYDFITPREE